MDRRTFLKSSGIGVALANLGPVAVAAPASAPSTQPDRLTLTAGPMLTNVTDTAVTVLVGVNALSATAVEYGPTESLGQTAFPVDSGLVATSGDVHKIRLTGLSPGARYFYRVRVTQLAFKSAYDVTRLDEATSDIRSFRTLSAGAATCSFGVINDTHEVQATMTALAGRIKEKQTDFTFWNGDIFNEMSGTAQATRQLIGFMGHHDVTAGQPMQLIRGNHDVRGAACREFGRFSDVFGGQFYGSFRHGPVAFICLDGGEDKPDSHPVYAGLNDFAGFRTLQRTWLAEELKKPHVRSAAFRVVFIHIPLRWRDETKLGSWCSDGRTKWHDLLADAQIDLVISGHTHQNAFLPADAKFPYAQLVGGGPKLAAATFMQATADAKRLSVRLSKATGEAIDEYHFDRRDA